MAEDSIRIPGARGLAAQVDRALDGPPVDAIDDTRELLDPLYAQVDRKLEQILVRHGHATGGADALRGFATLMIVARDEDGVPCRTAACSRCGAATSRTQRLLGRIADHSRFGQADALDVWIDPVAEGVRVQVDVDVRTIAGVLTELRELGQWLLRCCLDRSCGPATAVVSYAEDSFRLD